MTDLARETGDRRGSDDREGVGGEAMEIGTDERRMHVRAYNHWISLRRGRPYPAIEDLDPGSIADFGPNSVLLDFTAGVDDPAIRFLGRALRDECGAGSAIARISDVPGHSLLSRLTDQYRRIIANHAPAGFEAEFTSARGYPTLYRGILMPFSSDGAAIDFIYGVVNWKEMVDSATQSQLIAELEQARRTAPRPAAATATIWADGPSGGLPTSAPDVAPSLHDRLDQARRAAGALPADGASVAAVRHALAAAYGLAIAAEADPAGFTALCAESNLRSSARTPMATIVRLVFGRYHDRTRRSRHAALLAQARRLGVPQGQLGAFLESAPGGADALVRAEREERQRSRGRIAALADRLRGTEPVATVPLAAGQNEFVLLVGRRDGDAAISVLGRVDGDDALLRRAMGKFVD